MEWRRAVHRGVHLTLNLPDEYRHIFAWGVMLSSQLWYIQRMQELASDENAPIDAIYKRNGIWVSYTDITNMQSKQALDAILER